MVKTQKTRMRSFGKRSLSVVLALILVMSTCVVMLTASVFTASAAISYWFVSGNFNSWTQEATSVNKINGSSGSVTIPLTASSIKFKMIAYEDGNKWCGNSDGSLTVGTKKELSWNAGQDIVCALPDNTVAVTFKLDVENGKNYITVTATTTGGGGGGGTSPTKYTTTVNPNNDNNKTHNGLDSGSPIFWVDATYYDYLSDAELSGTWLYPDHVGTSNFNGNKDEWYPFNTFNKNVVKAVAGSNSGWAKPLYFGNFCNTFGAYDTSHHPGVTNGYDFATGTGYVTSFNYAANNSNGVYDRNTSVQELMGNTLQYTQLQTPTGVLAPYFNESALGSNAKIVKSSFPFRTTDYGTYKRYEFDSTNAKDNVFFTWETENGVTYPKYVNYGSGTNYGVKDGLKEFMNTTSGYGIFPFNNANTTTANQYKGTKTKTNEQLDYGFGIRMDMKFRIPEDTKVSFDFSGDDDLWMYITDETTKESQLALDMGGSHKESEGHVYFYKETNGVVDFTTAQSVVEKVDDPSLSNKDIFIQDYSDWGGAYIWAWGGDGDDGWYEGDGSSNHYRFRDNLIGSNGVELSKKTDFKFCKSKDWNINNQSGNSSGNLKISDYQGKNTYTNNLTYKDNAGVVSGHCRKVTSDFSFNPDHTYTMTIFYMERGLIESNCKMGFTLTPLGNNFIVTERINTTNINPGLQQKVLQLSNFGFNPYNNNSQLAQSTGYRSFNLGNGGSIEIPKEALPINSNVKVLQYAPANTYLTYSSVWDYYDKENGMIEFATGGHGTGITSNGVTTTTAAQTLINSVSQDPYDFAELQVDYENTPESADVTITKDTTDDSDKQFGATVYLALDYDGQGNPIYSTYDLECSDNMTQESYTASGGRITLQNGKIITIKGVPTGARLYVVEDDDEDYNATYSNPSDNPAIVGTTNVLTVTNTPKDVKPTDVTISGTKTLDGQNYTGRLFGFKLDGIAKLDGDVANAKDTSSTHLTVAQNQVTDGTFTFPKITFTEEGVYRYHVYEDLSYLIGRYTWDSDIYQYIDKEHGACAEFLVTITITKNGTELSALDPVIVPYETTSNPITIADFNKTAVSAIVFQNKVEKGSITINKTNQAGENVSQTKFTLYKVDEDFLEEIDGMSDIDKYDAILALDNSAKVSEQTTNGSGIAEFNDLLIYKDGYTSSSQPAYQNYCLIESANSSGYNLNKTPHVFKFPTYDQEEEILKYHYEFDYVNGKLRMPDTAGSGMTALRYAGMFIVGMSLLTLAGFVLYKKRLNKSYSKAKHYK